MISDALLTISLSLLACVGDPPSSPTAIDAMLESVHQRQKIDPQPLTGDLQFLRRLSLDLRGRIPSLAEIEDFRRQPDRWATIDTMLESEDFHRFLAEVWTGWLIGYSNAFQTDRELFRLWLQQQIAANVSFQKMVQQMITATGSVAVNGPANFLARHYDQPVVAVCRSFLGVRIECAQCHDHPFDRWTQQDYRRMSNFFRPLRRRQRSGAITLLDRDPPLTGDDRPQFLTGARPRTGRYRRELALYLTNCKPFARNFANRCWYFLMGRGIVDPPDDHNQENPPVDRELLEYLADRAVDSDFDVKAMFREICRSHAYQRVSRSPDAQSLNYFAARQMKPMLPEQYVDSLATALDLSLPPARRQELIRGLVGPLDLNEEYHRTWDYRESAQSLMRTMAFDIQDRRLGSVDTMYMRMLTRRPADDELRICRDHAAADILFALAFGNEFYFNH